MTNQDKTPMDAEKQSVTTIHKNVYVALAAAQSEMGPLVKGATNPHFKKMYADLSSLVTAVRGPFNRNGLAFFHQIIRCDGGQDMRTIVVHGETDTQIECDVPLIVSKQDMQGMKSATTYAKRIGLESVSGVAPEDDDGQAAVSGGEIRQSQAPKNSPTPTQTPKPVDAGPFKASILSDINAAPNLDVIANIENHPKFKADMVKLREMSGDAAVEVEDRLTELKAKFKADGS